MIYRNVCLMLLALAAESSFADAFVDTNISAPDGKDHSSTGSITAQSSVTYGNGSASGSADLYLGVLKADVTGSGDPSQRLGTYASTSTPSFQDLVTFSPGASGTGYLEYRFDGTLNAPAGNTGADAYLAVTLNGMTLHQTYLLDFPSVKSPCFPSTAISECVEGSSIDEVEILPFQIGPGSFDFYAFLQVIGENGATGNFSDTAAFYLALPPGVTYTSKSGSFLDGAVPIIATSVPEPETYILLLVGLGLVAGVGGFGRGKEKLH